MRSRRFANEFVFALSFGTEIVLNLPLLFALLPSSLMEQTSSSVDSSCVALGEGAMFLGGQTFTAEIKVVHAFQKRCTV